MFRIRPELNLIKLGKGFNQAFEASGRRIFLKALRAWLRAMIAAIPVYEGTARGGLRPLGRFLKITVPIAPVGPGRKNHKIRGKNYTLGPGAGEQYTDYDINLEGPQYTFDFYETLPYVIWNNFGRPLPEVKSAPWFAFQKATSAYNETIKQEIQTEADRLLRILFK